MVYAVLSDLSKNETYQLLELNFDVLSDEKFRD